MEQAVVLSLKIYALAIVISMAVALLIKLIGSVMGRIGAPHVPADRPQAPSETAEVPPEDIAAIAACLSAVIGAHRIVHLHEHGRGHDWALEGRAAQHGSHSPQRGAPTRRR